MGDWNRGIVSNRDESNMERGIGVKLKMGSDRQVVKRRDLMKLKDCESGVKEKVLFGDKDVVVVGTRRDRGEGMMVGGSSWVRRNDRKDMIMMFEPKKLDKDKNNQRKREREDVIIRDDDEQSRRRRIDNDREEDEEHHHRMSRNISPKKMVMVLDETQIDTSQDGEMEKSSLKIKSEEYPPFRKNFYVEAKEISNMTCAQVSAYREQLDLKCFGSSAPKPIYTWNQAGLSTILLDTLKRLNLEKPLQPIQAQALPVIMSGRDCIGLYRTGPGRTLAFLLPMLTHIKDQPPLVSGDGPIGLIMAPTRAAVRLLHKDILRFIEPLGLTCVPLCGGRGLAQQIDQLKHGAEILICTPDMMLDMLFTTKTASGGEITNLHRVTYLVVDETDRMFGMGFEWLMKCIIYKTRPDRQIVLFSATSLRDVRDLAQDFLTSPVHIEAGSGCFDNGNVRQRVEIRPEDERFSRLLELLGKWYEKGKILLCVESLDKCAALSKYLYGHGYPCLCLYDEEQEDFESVISDFETQVFNILVVTSEAAMGLAVRELELVINIDVPKHYGYYVHRVGLAGRPGKKGLSIAFISKDEVRYAPILASALRMAHQVQCDDFKALAEQARREGYYLNTTKVDKKDQKQREIVYGFRRDFGEEVVVQAHDSEDENDGVRKASGSLSPQAVLSIAAASEAMAASSLLSNTGEVPVLLQGVVSTDVAGGDGAEDAMLEHYEAELDINDFPVTKRWRVARTETLRSISASSGVAITVKGRLFPPGTIAGPCDRKLYLFIEGTTEQSVKLAKTQLKKVLENTQGFHHLAFT